MLSYCHATHSYYSCHNPCQALRYKWQTRSRYLEVEVASRKRVRLGKAEWTMNAWCGDVNDAFGARHMTKMTDWHSISQTASRKGGGSVNTGQHTYNNFLLTERASSYVYPSTFLASPMHFEAFTACSPPVMIVALPPPSLRQVSRMFESCVGKKRAGQTVTLSNLHP